MTSSEPITFVFDSPLMLGEVSVESAGRAPRIARGEDLVTVYPGADLLPGERVRLSVRFADDAAPTRANIWLVGHSVRGVRRVEVFRHPRSAEALQEEIVEAQAQIIQCQEQKTRLLAERRDQGGLMGVAWMERIGAVTRNPLRVEDWQTGNTLALNNATSYSHAASVAVRLVIQNPGASSWTAAGARLTNDRGLDLSFSLGPEPTVASGTRGIIVAGADKGPEPTQCPCILKLWEANGPRTIIVRNVTFPEPPP
jgi:uncharacterized protein (TIGR02268 family)